MKYENIPEELVSLVNAKLGDEADTFLEEISKNASLEYAVPPLLDSGNTYGNWNMPFFSRNPKKQEDYRPDSALNIEIITQMLKSAPVRFALEMKRAQIISVFRNRRSWKITSPDSELAEVVTANFEKILPKMSLDFSYSSLAYGSSFQELVWEYKTKYELGLIEDETEKKEDDKTEEKLEDKPEDKNKKFIVAKIPNSVDPGTVSHIKRTKDGSFDGFVQKASHINTEDIDVEVDSALIMPYDEKFRNLWGESMLKPMYPIWFWYEVVLRSMVKYMERMGNPVTVVKAPSRSKVIKPGTTTKIDGMVWGMEIASNVSRSSAAVLPSDTDEQGKPLWEISYLNATEKSQPFLDILELLTQMILRAGLSADRALSQSSGGVGSYNIGEIHKEATSFHNESILAQWVHYLNTYFLPHYSLYNRGVNGPPIWLETQGLDPTDQQNLTTILGVAQSMPGFQEVGDLIDWEMLLTNNNIPMISPEEAESKRQKREEDNLKKQEETLAVQSKFNAPSPTKQPDGTLKANLPNKPAPDKNLEDDDIVRLGMGYNPFRDKVGRFASGSSKGGAGLMTGPSGEIKDLDQAVKLANNKSGLGSFVKIAGLTLGVGGVGLAAYAILNKPKDNLVLGNGDSIQDLIDKGLISEEQLAEMGINKDEDVTPQEQEVINQVIADAADEVKERDLLAQIEKTSPPRFASTEDALAYFKQDMEKLGYDLPVGMSVIRDRLGVLAANDAAAMYNPIYNAIIINPDDETNILTGNGYERHSFMHEVFHAGQESGLFGSGLDVALSSKNNTDVQEGINELVTKIYSKDKFGSYIESSDPAYHKEVATMAGVAKAGSVVYGGDPYEFAMSMHKGSSNAANVEARLKDLFPKENVKNASTDQITQWLDEYYNIDTEQSYQELLK